MLWVKKDGYSEEGNSIQCLLFFHIFCPIFCPIRWISWHNGISSVIAFSRDFHTWMKFLDKVYIRLGSERRVLGSTRFWNPEPRSRLQSLGSRLPAHVGSETPSPDSSALESIPQHREWEPTLSKQNAMRSMRALIHTFACQSKTCVHVVGNTAVLCVVCNSASHLPPPPPHPLRAVWPWCDQGVDSYIFLPWANWFMRFLCLLFLSRCLPLPLDIV